MAKSYEELKKEISTITNEVEDGANTANRIGNAMADIVDYAKEVTDIQSEETDKKVSELEASTEQKLKDLVVQGTGDGENVAMSQKAVTEKVTELESEVVKTNDGNISVVNLASLPKVKGALSKYTWSYDDFNRFHKVIPLEDVKEVVITANEELLTRAVFVTEYIAPTSAGQTIPIAYNGDSENGGAVSFTIDAGTSKIIPCPSDATHLIVNINSNSGDMSPSRVVLRHTESPTQLQKDNNFRLMGAVRDDGKIQITETYRCTDLFEVAPKGKMLVQGVSGGASTYLFAVYGDKTTSSFISDKSILGDAAYSPSNFIFENVFEHKVYVRISTLYSMLADANIIIDNTGVVINNSNLDMSKEANVNLEDYGKVAGSLSGASPAKWTLDEYNRYHKAIPIPTGVKAMRITANNSLPAAFILLKSYTAPLINGESMDYAFGFAKATAIAVGETMTIDNIGGATYLIVTTNSNSEDKSPSAITFISDIVEEDVEKPVKLSILTCNPGSYEGKGYDRGSEELLQQYRLAISKARADIGFIQADTQYVDANGTRMSKDEVFANFKHWYAEGNSEFNYKAFATNYGIRNIAAMPYVNIQGTHYHNMFMVGHVVIDGKVIYLANLHLDWYDVTTRREQIAQVIEALSKFDNVIVAGDMNPSIRVNGEIPNGEFVYGEATTYKEDNAMWEAAGYKVANGGKLGVYHTNFEVTEETYGVLPYDNIYVKGGYISSVERIVADYMNDHAYLQANIVF